MINKYVDFILEGRGISDIIKEYSVYIYDIYTKGDMNIQLDLDYKELPLFDLRITFKLTNKYRGDFNPLYSTLKDDNLHDILIQIDIDKNNIIKHKIIGILAHELTHIKEYYEIQKKIEKLNIDIKPYYIKIRESYKELNIKEESYFYNFIYLLYLSLDTEMNARISQIYEYFYEFNSKDENFLFEKLKEHENWLYLEMLNNFDNEDFVKKNLNEIGLNGLIDITNEIVNKFENKEINKYTKLLTFVDNVKNIEDVNLFYKNFSTYFRKKCEKHIDKFKYLIKEVIEDLNGNRPYNEAYRINKKFNF